jgi:fumarate hydratase class I
MVNEGVRRAYGNHDNPLRASILRDPAGKRSNTNDNTPAVIHYEIVAGDSVDVIVLLKAVGQKNKSKLAMLNPSDSIVDWVLKLSQQWALDGVPRHFRNWYWRNS